MENNLIYFHQNKKDQSHRSAANKSGEDATSQCTLCRCINKIKLDQLNTNILSANTSNREDQLETSETQMLEESTVCGPANDPNNLDFYFYCHFTHKDSLDVDAKHLSANHLANNHQAGNKSSDTASKKSRAGVKKCSRFTRCCAFIGGLQKCLKCFVDSKFFQRGILFAILINTLSMGIEHHEQPPILTAVVEYSNIFFTVVFFIEMMLKLVAYGAFDYIKNAYNLFDGIIVGISTYEVIKQVTNYSNNPNEQVVTSTGVSVLRTFRLLRILKLVRLVGAALFYYILIFLFQRDAKN
jgi:hypothetical protein